MYRDLKAVDRHSPIPLHRQIRRSLRAVIAANDPGPSIPLPSAKALAAIFGVNRLTVLKAVRYLVAAGELRSVPGKGVYTGNPSGRTVAGDEAAERRFFEGIAEGPEFPPHETEGDRPEAFGRFLSQSLNDGIISFAAGFPPKEWMPTDALRRVTTRILKGDTAGASLGYAHGEGYGPLLVEIRRLLSQRGLELNDNDRILVTSGAQQAVALCLARFFDRGGALAMESPGYLGVIAACRQRAIPMVPVAVDAGGLHLRSLVAALKRPEVRGVYTVPTFQNPTGVTQLLARRKQILTLVEKRDGLIIEDDTYADLRFGGKAVPPIKSLPGGARVIYIGSFSKSLCPGLRIGFLAASGDIAQKLLHLKETADISTGTFSQAITAEFMGNGGYRRHLTAIQKEYRKRRDAMMVSLHRHLGGLVRIWPPKGGLHLFIAFERPLDMEALEARCGAEGVLFAPASLFFSDGRRPGAMRLNFAAHNAAGIEEGIRRLADCVKKEMK